MQQVKMPDGSVLEFADNASDDEIIQQIKNHPSSNPRDQAGMTSAGQAYRVGDTSSAPGIIEQFAGGAKHGWDRAAYALEKMVTGNIDQEHRSDLHRGRAFVADTGPASTIGQVASEAAMTAPAARGAQFLVKSLPYFGARMGGFGVGQMLSNATGSAASAAALNQAAAPGEQVNPQGAALTGALSTLIPMGIGNVSQRGINIGRTIADLLSNRENQAISALLRHLRAAPGPVRAQDIGKMMLDDQTTMQKLMSSPETAKAIAGALRGGSTTLSE